MCRAEAIAAAAASTEGRQSTSSCRICLGGRRLKPRRLPENQRQIVVVADAELTPAVERLIEVFLEPHLRFFSGAAGQSGLRHPELPLFEQFIEFLNAIGEEPQAHVARAGGPARAQRKFPFAETQPGKYELAALLVAILCGEADRFVPADRGAHIGDPKHRRTFPDRARDCRQLLQEAWTL